MADRTPGAFAYFIDGQGVWFINENDSKLIIRSDPPEVEVSPGNVYPTTGSITVDEKTPLLANRPQVPTKAVTLTGIQPTLPTPRQVDPLKKAVTLAGQAPTLNHTVLPTADGLSITEQSVARWTGLWFESDKITVTQGVLKTPLVGAFNFASEKPDVASPPPGSSTRIPKKKSVTLAGAAPLAVVNHVTSPPTGLPQIPRRDASINIKANLVYVHPYEYPQRGQIGITGYAPDLIGEGQVGVIIEGPFNYGTIIRNENATTDVPKNYQIDDRTGFKVKVKKPLMEEYTGVLTRPESFDKRSEQEFLRSKPERHRGAMRPEPVGNERFVEDEYPDGVTQDDL
jgi:hypothetical protein